MTNPKQMQMSEDDLTTELNTAAAAEHLEVTGEDDVELSEELADTATIETLFDAFIEEVSQMFTDAIDVSLEGNAVRSHIELQNFGEETITLAYQLRNTLISKVANRAEVVAEEGNTLRKQVIGEE